MRSWMVVISLCAGCGASSQAPAASPTPAPRSETPPLPLRESMRHHFEHATAARDAVIAGRLADVRLPLQAIATAQPSSEVPNDWLPWLEEMQATARKGASASTLEEAAVVVAALGNTCGECHRTTHGGQHDLARPAHDYEAKDREGLKEKMARHKFSADALWFGLTGPEHQAWSEGASALMNINVPGLVNEHGTPATKDRPATGESSLRGPADPRLPSQDEPDSTAGKPGTVDLDAALRELRALGGQADQAKTAAEKQAVFAQMIARCGNCHATVGAHLP